jgi:Domain of unknown function (DUF4406)
VMKIKQRIACDGHQEIIDLKKDIILYKLSFEEIAKKYDQHVTTIWLIATNKLYESVDIRHDKIVYLAGKMSGVPEHNYPNFFAAEARLRAAGYDVVNPARLNDSNSDPEYWYVCLRNDLEHIVKYCKGLALLPGWETSRGATLELATAIRLGMYIIDAVTLEPLDIQVSYNWTGKHGPEIILDTTYENKGA